MKDVIRKPKIDKNDDSCECTPEFTPEGFSNWEQKVCFDMKFENENQDCAAVTELQNALRDSFEKWKKVMKEKGADIRNVWWNY